MFFFPTVRDDATIGKARVTQTLIALNVIAFALTLFFGGRQIILEYGFIPALKTPITWITHMFCMVVSGTFWATWSSSGFSENRWKICWEGQPF